MALSVNKMYPILSAPDSNLSSVRQNSYFFLKFSSPFFLVSRPNSCFTDAVIR